jgi:hypothetical protein
MSILFAVSAFPLSLLLAAGSVDAPQDPPGSSVELKVPAQSVQPTASERNVRVDVTVTVKSAEKSVAKSLSLVAADGREVKGRAGVQLPIVMMTSGNPGERSNVSYRDVGINVDATPRLLASGRISLAMNLSFSNVLQVQAAGTERPSFGSGQHETRAIVFESGKPLVVLEGGDPESGRTYTVQVTATILK